MSRRLRSSAACRLSILYDNLKIAVARILGDGKRVRTRAFTELVSHYLFADRFGRPGKGNDKGNVEGLVKYAAQELHGSDPACAELRGAQRACFWPAASAAKTMCCAALRPPSASAWRADIAVFRQDPIARLRAVRESRPPASARSHWCAIAATIIRFPRAMAIARSWSKASSTRSLIVCGADIIARHRRCYGKADLHLRSVALSGAFGAQAQRARPSRAPGKLGFTGGIRDFPPAAGEPHGKRADGASTFRCCA